MSEEKIDKDLTLKTQFPVTIIWEVQPNEDIQTRLLFSKDPVNEFVFFQACASEFLRLIEVDKKAPKHLRMSKVQKQQFATSAKTCQMLASRVGLKIYEEQIQLPDNRIVVDDPKSIIIH